MTGTRRALDDWDGAHRASAWAALLDALSFNFLVARDLPDAPMPSGSLLREGYAALAEVRTPDRGAEARAILDRVDALAGDLRAYERATIARSDRLRIGALALGWGAHFAILAAIAAFLWVGLPEWSSIAMVGVAGAVAVGAGYARRRWVDPVLDAVGTDDGALGESKN